VYDETRTIFTLPVSQEPGREYVVGLNPMFGGGFLSAEGVAFKEKIVKFHTRQHPDHRNSASPNDV
jgi:hypothetical protein